MMQHTLLVAALLIAAPAEAQTHPIKVQNAWTPATAAGAKAGGVFLTR
jgi:hypothetical protein